MGHLDSVQIRIGDLPKDALNHSMAPGLKENRKIYFEIPSDVYVLSYMPGLPVKSRFFFKIFDPRSNFHHRCFVLNIACVPSSLMLRVTLTY